MPMKRVEGCVGLITKEEIRVPEYPVLLTFQVLPPSVAFQNLNSGGHIKR